MAITVTRITVQADPVDASADPGTPLTYDVRVEAYEAVSETHRIDRGGEWLDQSATQAQAIVDSYRQGEVPA